MHFSEVIKLQFGKRIQYIALYCTDFRIIIIVA